MTITPPTIQSISKPTIQTKRREPVTKRRSEADQQSSLFVLLPKHGFPARVVSGRRGHLFVGILSGVRNLVFQDLDELVEDYREQCTDGGAEPVDPICLVISIDVLKR